LELLAAAADVAGGAESDYATLLAAQERGEDIGPDAAAAIAAHRQALLQQLIQQHQLLEVQQRQQDLGQGTAAAGTAAGEGQVPPPAPLLPDSFPTGTQPVLSVEAVDRSSAAEAAVTDVGSAEAAAAQPAVDPATLNQEQQRELLLQQLAAVVPPGMDISYLQALLASADPASCYHCKVFEKYYIFPGYMFGHISVQDVLQLSVFYF
jgi:hypothetical protein